MLRRVLVLMWVSAPMIASTAQSNQPSRAGRQMFEGEFAITKLASVGPGHEVERMSLIDGDSHRIYTFDYTEHRLEAIDSTGRIAWTVGGDRPGQPRFANPMDLKVGADGDVWLSDSPQRLVVRVHPNGQVSKRVIVTRDIDRIIPLSDGRFVGMGAASSNALAFEFDSTGNVVKTIPLLPPIDTVAGMARTTWASSASDASVVWAGLMYSGDLLRLDLKGAKASIVHGVETFPLPKMLEFKTAQGTISRVSPSATRGAQSIASDNSTLFVLFGGQSALKGRVIDSYDVATGTYLGSYELPSSASYFARVKGGFVAVIATADGPSLALLTWKRAKGA